MSGAAACSRGDLGPSGWSILKLVMDEREIHANVNLITVERELLLQRLTVLKKKNEGKEEEEEEGEEE